jgi:hypothetical protein
MTRRLSLAGLVLAAAAVLGLAAWGMPAATAASANARHVCLHLLNETEALHATGDDDGRITDARYEPDRLLSCKYGTQGSDGSHGIGLDFGTYRAFRESALFDGFESSVCYVSQVGCKLARQAGNSKSYTRSFALLAQAMAHAGITRRLHVFGQNPALIWLPKHPPLEHIAVAIVLHAHTGKVLKDTCTEEPTGRADEPDVTCTLQSLRRAYHNLVIGR